MTTPLLRSEHASRTPRAARRGALLLGAMLSAAAPAASYAATLEEVRANGALRCGVNPALPGFSSADSLGVFRGFDIDVCHAVAVAVFGDASAFEAVPLTADEQFEALASGRVEVLVCNVTWTLERNVLHGESSSVPTFTTGKGSWCETVAACAARSNSTIDASASSEAPPPS